MKLTKQGVRDLDSLGPKIKKEKETVPHNCAHKRMRDHCKIKGRGCGHLVCVDCGFFWDIGANCS